MKTLNQAKPYRAPALDSFSPLTVEQRQASLEQLLQACEWQPHQDVWVYGYGSLIWRPEFDFVEKRFATLRGHHRALCLWSRVNRGTPEKPGLVFGLDRGGSCRGVAYRLPAQSIPDTFQKLWAREMSTGAYVPKWLRCSTPMGDISTLCFVVNREAVSYVPKLEIEQTLEIITHAHGRYGPCVEYVLETHHALNAAGIQDKRLAAIAAAIGNPTLGSAAR
jgi:cation transport protein ChaC